MPERTDEELMEAFAKVGALLSDSVQGSGDRFLAAQAARIAALETENARLRETLVLCRAALVQPVFARFVPVEIQQTCARAYNAAIRALKTETTDA